MVRFVKGKQIFVRLVSMAGTGYFYTTSRNKAIDKLRLMKYDPIVKKHVLFEEVKVKKGKKTQRQAK